MSERRSALRHELASTAIGLAPLRFLGTYRRHRASTMVSRRRYLDNLQLIRSLSEIDGDFVECGVWRGGMIAGIAEIDSSRRLQRRRYVLLDSFEGLPPPAAIDGPGAEQYALQTDATGYMDNCRADVTEARAAMDRLSRPVHYDVIPGWFEHTVPELASEGRPIALLHLDCDWYDSVSTCLTHLEPLVVPGGLVLVDDYYAWDGCARAVHDHLSKTGAVERIRQTAVGGVAYMRKG